MDKLVQWTLILIAVFAFNLIAHADPAFPLPLNKPINIRTNSFGEGRVVATLDTWNDDRTLGIICERHSIFSSPSALLVLPNTHGDVLLYKTKHVVSVSNSPDPESGMSIPLAIPAMNAICKYPNGHYQISISRDDDGYHVNLVGGTADKLFSSESARPL